MVVLRFRNVLHHVKIGRQVSGRGPCNEWGTKQVRLVYNIIFIVFRMVLSSVDVNIPLLYLHYYKIYTIIQLSLQF